MVVWMGLNSFRSVQHLTAAESIIAFLGLFISLVLIACMTKLSFDVNKLRLFPNSELVFEDDLERVELDFELEEVPESLNNNFSLEFACNSRVF